MVFGMAGRVTDIAAIPCFSIKQNIECHEFFDDQLQFYKKRSKDSWISAGVFTGIVVLMLLGVGEAVTPRRLSVLPRMVPKSTTSSISVYGRAKARTAMCTMCCAAENIFAYLDRA